jgi:hypothetical protein
MGPRKNCAVIAREREIGPWDKTQAVHARKKCMG